MSAGKQPVKGCSKFPCPRSPGRSGENEVRAGEGLFSNPLTPLAALGHLSPPSRGEGKLATALALTSLLLLGCTAPAARPKQVQWVTRAGVVAPGSAKIDPHLPAPAAAALHAVELGVIPYDGLTLPLLAPDGRAIATQVGPTPEWSEALAEPVSSSVQARRRSVEIYTLAEGREPLRQAQLPAGVLLGRSAIEQGFLVEQPGEVPGSRRIGLAPWSARDGRDIVWLTPGGPEACAAFGVLGHNGELAFCIRAGADGPWSLHVRAVATDPSTQRECAMPGASLLFPVFEDAPNPRAVYALAAPFPADPDLPLLIVRFDLFESGRTIAPAAAAPIAESSTMFEAFQCVAAAQTPSPAALAPDWRGPRGVLLFSPGAQTCGLIRPGAGNALRIDPLYAGIFAATWADSAAERGIAVLGSTAADLVLQPWDAGIDAGTSGPGFGPPRLIRPGKSIPRRTSDSKRPYMLIQTLEPVSSRALGLFGLACKRPLEEPAGGPTP